jgi:hypothetical protein
MDAVEAAIDLRNRVFVVKSLREDACEGSVDNRGGTAALSDEEIALK